MVNAEMLEIDFFHLTDTGCVREENEDAIGSWPYEDGLLFAVADGMGGHNAGQVASALALEVLAREMGRAPTSWSIEKRLRRAVQEANLEIYYKATTVPELRGMGTTLTASVLVGSTLVTAHVGDCRLYLLRQGTFSQLTKDHTWVWEQMQYGILSEEEARNHPNRHVLSRSVGNNLIAAIDVLSINIQAGDVISQCSDGVHGLISEPEMVAMLQKGRPEMACKAIIERSREVGGHDNLSLQVATVLSSPPPASKSWWLFGR
jgi:protein phosphatase